MAVFKRMNALALTSWLAGKKRSVTHSVLKSADRFYDQICEIERRRRLEEIFFFAWTVRFRSDGTAVADNKVTGEFLELDSEQMAELWSAAHPRPAKRCTTEPASIAIGHM